LKDIALGNLIGHCRKGRSHPGQGSSYIKKETFSRWVYARSSRFSDGILIGGFTNLEKKQVFHQKLQLMEFMG